MIRRIKNWYKHLFIQKDCKNICLWCKHFNLCEADINPKFLQKPKKLKIKI